MPPRILFLTGAPASRSLDWDSDDLLEAFTSPVARFAGLSPSVSGEANPSPSFSEPSLASWRYLDVDRRHLPTGYSQGHMWTGGYQGEADFFNTSDLSFASSRSNLDNRQLRGDSESASEALQEVLSQFHEHSFTVHTTTASSQIATSQSREAFARPGSNAATSFESIGTSFTSETDRVSEGSPFNTLTRPAIPVRSCAVDLRDVPTARFLESIQPQTMTVDVIVGIISVAPPRAVKTRRGAEVELVELLVGDETKSGFGVNFWLSARSSDSNSEQNMDEFRHVLAALRPQDIVLLRNVALSSFRGKVYGQNLKKEMTKLHLLYRNRISRSDPGGYYKVGDFDDRKELHPQLRKTMHVKDWVLRFVAPGTSHRPEKDASKFITESLPLDTQ